MKKETLWCKECGLVGSSIYHATIEFLTAQHLLKKPDHISQMYVNVFGVTDSMISYNVSNPPDEKGEE